MAPRRIRKKGTSGARARATNVAEWVGGRVSSPFLVTEGEQYRPELVVWMDLPDGVVVGFQLQNPKAPVEFGTTYVEATRRPLVGPPRRPARVRVATADLAESVRRVAGLELELVVAPTPELDAVVEAMEQAPRDDALDARDLEEGRVSPETVAEMFGDQASDSEPGESQRTALRGPEPPVPRNAPCPCGSGKKYKKCHLASDEAKQRDAQAKPSVHEIDERVVDDMQRFATRRFSTAWRTALTDVFEDFEKELQLASPWSVYGAKVEGRPIVDWYLAERGRHLGDDERSWLEAQQRSWLTVWEVLDVDPGRGLSVRDLFTGEERHVMELKASQVLVKRDAVLGRIVDHGGTSVFCGLHPSLLPPLAAAELARKVNAWLRLETAPTPGRLRDEVVGRFMIRQWQEAAAARQLRANVPPQLTNTDGEKLKLTTDVFRFSTGRRAAVEDGLRTIDDVDLPDADDPRYVFLRGGRLRRGEEGRTVLGRVTLGDGELRLETNSLERADALRARIERACPGLLAHVRRDHADPFAPRLVGKASPPSDVAEPAGMGEAVRAFKRRHYQEWADSPVPALQGKTPREAVRTREGRQAVDMLLKAFENSEHRAPPEVRFDFAGIRRLLDLPT